MTEQKPEILPAEQVPAAVNELFSYQALLDGMRTFFPAELCEQILSVKDEITDVHAFQAKMVYPVLKAIEAVSVRQITTSGLEALNPAERYLFISNHRDIVLDSAFMNTELFDHGFETAPMAVGDNLMRHRISELIFLLNKSFVVKRTGTPIELYRYSVELSSFIHDQIVEGKSSIWIAQREGRAKDGNDRTQVGLLKMLSLSAKTDLPTYFRELKVVPVSISYEIDPCGVLKTQEYLRKQRDPEYKKTYQEDAAYMLQGLKGKKGHIHIHYGAPLNTDLEAMETAPNAKKQLEALAGIIDQSIHRNYYLHPNNYVAYSLLHGPKHDDQFTAEERASALAFFDRQFQFLGEEAGEAGRQYLLGIYAWPVVNKFGA